ncbi:hypothetical protein JAAARDRAFT_146391, partial [Jaapia argillacea MUCL 33604]
MSPIFKPSSMRSPENIVIAIALLALCAVAYTRFFRSRVTLAHLPPGPTGHWFFGNTIPKLHAHRKFEEWTQEYGSLFTLKRGRELIIVVGRYQAATDIMEKEGASLVDRPRSISGGETLSGGMRTLLVGAGDRLRKLRRALHSQLQSKVAETYEPIQMMNAKNVILDILARPSDHQAHARRYAASVIMSITYGKATPTSYSDPSVQKVNICAARLGSVLTPGAYFVESFPFLRYLPGYLDQLRQWHREELSLFRGQLDEVRKQMAVNQARPCFAKYLLERQQEFELTDDELAYLAGSMFGAGSDTSAAAISIVIMAAACFPRTQLKVQEELDTVVGRDRLPTFGDMDALPQTIAFVMESFRWRPVSAGGFMHRATKDIIWKNYVIPAGATVAGNHWSIGRDPEVFPDPETFNPQRWINKDGNIRDDIRYFNFGFGRRVCVGQHVANRSLFINTALLLWAFTISQNPAKPIDTLAFTNTANVHPLPFEAKFEPRIDD